MILKMISKHFRVSKRLHLVKFNLMRPTGPCKINFDDTICAFYEIQSFLHYKFYHIRIVSRSYTILNKNDLYSVLAFFNFWNRLLLCLNIISKLIKFRVFNIYRKSGSIELKIIILDRLSVCIIIRIFILFNTSFPWISFSSNNSDDTS